MAGCGAMGRLGLVRAKNEGTSTGESWYLSLNWHSLRGRGLCQGRSRSLLKHQRASSTKQGLRFESELIIGDSQAWLPLRAIAPNFRFPRPLHARAKVGTIGFESLDPGSF
jgi:hypothetical protein